MYETAKKWIPQLHYTIMIQYGMHSGLRNLVPRPFVTSSACVVFDCLQYAKKEGEGGGRREKEGEGGGRRGKEGEGGRRRAKEGDPKGKSPQFGQDTIIE